MISIQLNGEPRDVAEGITLADLLAELQVAVPTVAVEVNQELVPRARHAQRKLAASDQVEIVSFKGGG